MDEFFRQAAPIHAVQLPYNLFERQAESGILPYARQHNIACPSVTATLCRGLLTGTIRLDDPFQRRRPAAAATRSSQEPPALSIPFLPWQSLNRYARECLWPEGHRPSRSRWVLDQGNTIAAVGGRGYPEQLDSVKKRDGVGKLDENGTALYRRKVIRHTVKDPVGPEFMAAPLPSKRRWLPRRSAKSQL